MKLVSVILAILILYLNLMPCDDAKCANVDIATSHFHTQDNHGDHSDTDDCSPFCVCSCCNTSILLISDVSDTNTPVRKANLMSETEEFNSFSFFDFWRPPQS